MTALHHLNIYVPTIHEYEGEFMLCPDITCGTLKINANLHTLEDALNMDDIIILLSKA